MPRQKPTPPSATAIEDDLAAALAALGLGEEHAGVKLEDRILAEFRRQIREKGHLVAASDVAAALDVGQTTVSAICRRLVDRGRMLRTINQATSRTAFVPAPEK